MDIKDSILETIGRTPLVRLRRMGAPDGVELLAKLEGANPMGSVKERIALAIIEAAERDGSLTRDAIILESSSGNTGIGLAMVGAARGYRVLIVMSEKVSIERRQILKALGAEVVLTPAEGGSDAAWALADQMHAREPHRYFRVAQYANPNNPSVHYRATAMEIWEQTDGRVDALVATLGTTGTIVGAGRRLKELNPRVRVVAAEPQRGHQQQGLRNLKESRVPEVWDPSVVDETIEVADVDAFRVARELARREGIFGGISSGTAVHAALALAAGGLRGTIVAILPDRGEKYLSTPLYPAA
ncbi:MAG TPA: cysteine synthase family protein [Candidatus Polarisedimenticolia bacterium]|jgi:cysteine synthase